MTSGEHFRQFQKYAGVTIIVITFLGTKHAEAIQPFARDCAEIKTTRMDEFVPSGVYTISPIPGAPVQVFCDMEDQGGGWTVIQQRGYQVPHGSTRQDFYLPWNDYEQGFGSHYSDYWLGLLHISALTRLQDSELYIDMMDWDLNLRYANYEQFHVGNSLEKYNLTIAGFDGNAGDSFSYHNGQLFTTLDQDNDSDKLGRNCAKVYMGGWWYNSCHWAHLNGMSAPEGSNGTMPYGVGINWATWRFPDDRAFGHNHSLKQVRMKIRSRANRNRNFFLQVLQEKGLFRSNYQRFYI